MITQYHVNTPRGRLHVPYVARWNGEHADVESLRWSPGYLQHSGFRYIDETAADRDRGVLWLRETRARGRGDAELAGIHSPRQREAMSALRCQVCGEDVHDLDFAAWGQRYLFVSSKRTPLVERALVASPPVHRACAMKALAHCTPLRTGAHLALVRSPTAWGVEGLVHHAKTGAPLGKRTVQYGDRVLWHTLALRAVVALHGCTPITARDLTHH